MTPPDAATPTPPRYLGVDLAWRDSTPERPANETGLDVIDADGTVLDAGWARGVDEVEAWVSHWSTPGSVVAIDAPVLVPNATGMRASERLVARAYGRWHVSANASSASLPWLGGRTLGERLERAGGVYDDGGLPRRVEAGGRFEGYPYTTLGGMSGLGYDDKRPRDKRPDLALPKEARREARATACDELLRRLAGMAGAEVPVRLDSHPVSAALLDEPSPLVDRAYKHREDLPDAPVCAGPAALRARTPERLQVLGADPEPDDRGRRATLISPARPERRLGPTPVARVGRDARRAS
ncbi:hypothetical protein [Frigoribacterium sp. RIT-PI-h]|uniref:hypothetical protein n=1 Tax=Frigoribacterium sp. RIT-PI-h TaxID=1690245 RepID=UPI0006B9A0FB|nr:hypothetical protein [Frigoribacterium sp. RIT-PI-h]KPG88920.1 hypothetical protein AEQ27_00100 [Frigoribacterium sp. RIT-PI-h]